MENRKALMEFSFGNDFMPGDECTEMEIDETVNGSLKDEEGEASYGNVLFSRENPMVSNKHSEMFASSCTCGAARKLKSGPTSSESEPRDSDIGASEKKLSRQGRIELGRMFQAAVSCHDWELAESLIVLADPQTLNNSLCISLDSVWFLSTEEDLFGITEIIKKIIANGAYDFTRAALRTSFLASCVSACQCPTMSLADTVSIMAVRLHERLQECNGDEVLKAAAGAKVQKFTEWALKCIGFIPVVRMAEMTSIRTHPFRFNCSYLHSKIFLIWLEIISLERTLQKPLMQLVSLLLYSLVHLIPVGHQVYLQLPSKGC